MYMYGEALFFTQTSETMTSVSHYANQSPPGHMLSYRCSSALQPSGPWGGSTAFFPYLSLSLGPVSFFRPTQAFLCYYLHTLCNEKDYLKIVNSQNSKQRADESLSARLLNLFGESISLNFSFRTEDREGYKSLPLASNTLLAFLWSLFFKE